MAILKRPAPREDIPSITGIHTGPTAGADGLPAQSPSGRRVEDVASILSLLVYNTTNGLWMSDRDFRESVEKRFAGVDAALAKAPEIRFSCRQEQLMGNGQLIEAATHYVSAFVRRLTQLGIENFTLTRGLTKEEFQKLIELLGKAPSALREPGGFQAAIKNGDFKNVVARKFTLLEVASDEMVVTKDAGIEADVAKKKDAATSLVEFLAVQSAAADDGTVESAKAISEDPGAMASVLVQAAEQRQAAQTEDKKTSKADIMTDCLRRTFTTLLEHRSGKTQAGRKAIRKTLKQLEKDLTTAMGTEADPAVAEAVAGTLRQLDDGMKVADIAADYAKKLKVLESSEKRILRFIKAHGLEETRNNQLESHLQEDGLDVSAWHRLLAKSGAGAEAGDVPAGSEESARAVAHLAYLIGQIESHLKTEPTAVEAAPAEVADRLKQANEEAGNLVKGTQQKIDVLVKAVNSDLGEIDAMERAAKAAGEGPKLTRKRMVEMLAEIVQEVWQPISVVNCSLELVLRAKAGEIGEMHIQMLKLAAESVERIGVLISGLQKISGMPDTMNPDQQILGKVYGKKE